MAYIFYKTHNKLNKVDDSEKANVEKALKI